MIAQMEGGYSSDGRGRIAQMEGGGWKGIVRWKGDSPDGRGRIPQMEGMG